MGSSISISLLTNHFSRLTAALAAPNQGQSMRVTTGFFSVYDKEKPVWRSNLGSQ
jgi:hypothetical protein